MMPGQDDTRRIDTPVGPVAITACNGEITAITLQGLADSATIEPEAIINPIADEANQSVITHAIEQISAYCAGTRTLFELPLMTAPTRFQARVRDAMCAIPFGQVQSYGALARLLGSSPRAVGRACGANPLPIVVPCHRVVASHGPGGYSGADGLATIHRLLLLEGRRDLLDLFGH